MVSLHQRPSSVDGVSFSVICTEVGMLGPSRRGIFFWKIIFVKLDNSQNKNKKQKK